VRQLIIALILATDTKYHLEALADFRLRLNAFDSSEDFFDPFTNAKDQQEALCIMFRAADIGHSAKTWKIHHLWSQLVSEEFHQQGDEETKLGVPLSPLCKREGFVLCTAQMGFLQFICLPTWREIARWEAQMNLPGDEPEVVPAAPIPGQIRSSTGTESSRADAHPSTILAVTCLGQCESNFKEWQRQSDALKAKEKDSTEEVLC